MGRYKAHLVRICEKLPAPCTISCTTVHRQMVHKSLFCTAPHHLPLGVVQWCKRVGPIRKKLHVREHAKNDKDRTTNCRRGIGVGHVEQQLESRPAEHWRCGRIDRCWLESIAHWCGADPFAVRVGQRGTPSSDAACRLPNCL